MRLRVSCLIIFLLNVLYTKLSVCDLESSGLQTKTLTNNCHIALPIILTGPLLLSVIRRSKVTVPFFISKQKRE